MPSINSKGFGGETPFFIHSQPQVKFDIWKPLRRRLDSIEIQTSETAHFIAKIIPAQCPFERTIKMFGFTIISIPPLCKLNPVYDELVSLRFRSLCFLVDRCGEDISNYC